MSAADTAEARPRTHSTLSYATLMFVHAIGRMRPEDVATHAGTLFGVIHDQVLVGAEKSKEVPGDLPSFGVETLAPAMLTGDPELLQEIEEPKAQSQQRREAVSLRGSTVTAEVWNDVPEATRRHFQELIAEHKLRIGPNGLPIPNTPDGTIGGGDTMYDPMTGERLNMLKRRIGVYDLTAESFLTMFGLPADQPLVSRHYSERKRVENLKENRGEIQRTKRPPAWKGQTPATRRRFAELIRKHDLKVREDGYPIPNTPDGTFGGVEAVYDPMTGEAMNMLTRRLMKVYKLTPEEAIAMFGMPEDTPMVSKAYSDRKRDETEARTNPRHASKPDSAKGRKSPSAAGGKGTSQKARRKVAETA